MEWLGKLAHAGTLLIVNALLAALSSAIFLALHLTQRKVRRVRGVLLWGLSYAAFAAGFAVLFLPAFHIDFARLGLVGNLLIDAGAVLGYLAVHAYLEQPARKLWVLWPVAAIGIAEAACVLVQGENYRVMVVLGGVLRGLITVATGLALWRGVTDSRRVAARLAALFYFLWAFMLLYRVAWWMLHPAANVSQEPTSTFGLLSRLILTWVVTPSFLWMLTRQLDDELIRHAHEDPLTGIANRRVMWEHGERRVANANRDETAMAVLMIDTDHFKAINDRWGHDVGDQVLVAIADTLKRHLREENLLARVGGEEFMVLVRRGDAAMAGEIAERLRSAVENHAIALPSGETLRCTASIGYCVAIPGDANWRAMVVAADRALYAAKQQGRNRVVRGEVAGAETG
ncbi:GGDEF domain-containing protein [Dyella sp. BiH032]|uniref:GGDEF domain-containing protein n=1 Tax=Dyella sp. BiH032 TaxID=3075430 RepID=UPI002892F31D|nr:GGDEF domain-containing protein [Dyella sp. BiH032]WNL44080.1 GGDEF domain-containing protein [Dyella sp. BiH032]